MNHDGTWTEVFAEGLVHALDGPQSILAVHRDWQNGERQARAEFLNLSPNM